MKKLSAAKKYQNHLRSNATLTAATLTIVHTAALVWLGHLVFICATFYNMAMVVTMTPTVSLSFYTIPDGWICNLPQLLFGVSALAVIVVFLGSLIYMKHSKAKIRQRCLLALTSFCLLVYSLGLCLMEKSVHDFTIESLDNYENHEADDWYSKQQLMKIRKTLDGYHRSKG